MFNACHLQFSVSFFCSFFFSFSILTVIVCQQEIWYKAIHGTGWIRYWNNNEIVRDLNRLSYKDIRTENAHSKSKSSNHISSPVNLPAKFKKILFKRVKMQRKMLYFVINLVMTRQCIHTKKKWLDSVLVQLIKMSNYTSNNKWQCPSFRRAIFSVHFEGNR